MPLFHPSDGVFEQPDVLSEDYVPDDILGRDEEVNEYKHALQPIMDGRRTKSILLYGKSGVGKTVVTKYLTQHLTEDVAHYRDIDLTTVWVLCENINTSYQLAAAIINTCREPINEISDTGYSTERMYTEMFRELEDAGDHVLVVLDEVDNLGTDDKLLYELPRATANDRVSEIDITVIGISNDLKFKDRLRAKVKSSLAQKELYFPPYGADELCDILAARADLAFYEETLTNDVIPLCAGFAAQDVGDARQALDLLNEAGELANRDDAATVTETHVRRAKETLQQDLLTTGVQELTTQATLALVSLAVLDLQNETPVRSKEIYTTYRSFARRIDADIVTQRRLRDHLGSLHQHGLAHESTTNTGSNQGRYKEYTLASLDGWSVINEVEQNDRFTPLISTIETDLHR